MRGSSLLILVALAGAGCASTSAPETGDDTASTARTRLPSACPTVWYADRDADGFGTPRVFKRACSKPAGFVSNSLDCSDLHASRHPGADEYCDGFDQDCDAEIDEGAVDADVWYADKDGDGYGAEPLASPSCEPPTGYVAEDGDCDDADAALSPGAPEACDGADNDCDATADEDSVCVAVTSSGTEICDDGVDQDGDGLGCEPRGTLDVWTGSVPWSSGMTGAGTGWDAEYAGDVDGDGFDDFLTGGPAFWSGDVGETRLVYGTNTLAGGVQPLGGHPGFQGAAASDFGGYASAPAGDVDADGYDDFIVAAPGSDLGAVDGGAAFLVYGGGARQTGVTDMSTLGARFLGQADYDFAGASVMGLGHFDGDAYADFAIGSAGTDFGGVTDAGAVSIFYGGATPYSGNYQLSTAAATVHGTSTWTAMADQNGIASADLDADGMDDLLVGAWDFSGARYGADVFLFYGDGTGLAGDVPVTAADAQFHGTVGWWSYIELANAGDVNGDGYEEILIGLPDQQADEMGAAYLFYGSSLRESGTIDDYAADAIFNGSPDNDYELTVTAGDINGDALSDVVIGSPWNSTSADSAGAVYVWYGGTLAGAYSATAADAQYYGTTADGHLGSDVAAGGDMDGDGFQDLIIGGYGEASSDGSAFLVLGSGF
jgi:hypothetical protein